MSGTLKIVGIAVAVVIVAYIVGKKMKKKDGSTYL